MCRFVAYLGKEEELIANLVSNQTNSLIHQSKHAEESKVAVHADGVGLAWYKPDLDEFPGIYRSIQPVWNDLNLKHLVKKIRSECFLGHIRASTIGDVNQHNCHPFYYEKYSLVHNGSLRYFETIRRKLLAELNDDLFLQAKGTTDSECLFLLIMQYLYEDKCSFTEATFKAFKWVIKQQKSLAEEYYSKINIALTDGNSILATRYASKDNPCLSLHYSTSKDSIIISSEPLDNTKGSWEEVPENHYIYVEKENMSPIIKPIKL